MERPSWIELGLCRILLIHDILACVTPHTNDTIASFEGHWDANTVWFLRHLQQAWYWPEGHYGSRKVLASASQGCRKFFTSPSSLMEVTF